MRRTLAALIVALGLASLSGPTLAAVCTPTPALPDTERRTEYAGIVAQTGPFNTNFQIYGDNTDFANWIEVWVNGNRLVGTTDYTVDSPTGPLANLCRPITDARVTFTAAQTGTIEILGARRPRRASQVSENAGVTARTFNQVVSDLTAELRERWDWESRALRTPPGETLSVLAPAATRANKFLIFDSSGNPSLTSPTPGLGNVVGPATSVIGNVANWNNATGTVLADAGVASASIIKTVDDYGASTSNSGAANLTAFQAAVAGTPPGGTLAIKQRGYALAGTWVVNKNIKILCANADPTVNPTISQTTTTATTLAIRSGYVTVENCSFGLAGTPAGAATGITVGDDAIQVVNGGSFTNTSATLTCASCSFTVADVGKGIWANNVGAAAAPLFTKITAFIDAAHVTMANAAGATQAAQTFAYGFDYQEVVLKDLQVYNYVRGIDIVAATQFHVDHVYAFDKFPLRIQNILWGDSGDGEVSRGTWFSNDNAAGIAVQYQSGGILRFIGNKVLGGLDCIQINWNYITSIGPLVTGNSIEGGCTHGLNVSNSVALSGGTFSNNEIGVTGTAVFVSSASTWSNWTFSGNHIISGGGNTAFSIANSANCTMANNTIATDGVASAAYSIASTAANCVLRPGATTAAAVLTNLSSTTLIDDQRGMLFASVPTVAANGSRIFITDGTPNTSPCTGSSTGATAFRQNGAWTCGTAVANPLPVSQGGIGTTTLTNHSVLLGQGTSAVGAVAVMSDGQILVGQTGADPVQKTLSGAGTLTALGALTINLGAGATVTGITPGANGGTGNGFFAVSGPATSLKTFTFPNASATVLTDNAAVTIAQGGTNNTAAYTAGSIVFSDGTKLTQKNANLFWDNSNNRICVNVGAGCSFPMSVIGNAQWGSSLSGAGISYQMGGGNAVIVGINYNNDTFNTMNLSATGSNDLAVATSGAVSARLSFTAPWLRVTPTTVASLPTCNAGQEGTIMYVTDQATAVAYRGAVTGSGATRQAVLCSNSAWIQD